MSKTFHKKLSQKPFTEILLKSFPQKALLQKPFYEKPFAKHFYKGPFRKLFSKSLFTKTLFEKPSSKPFYRGPYRKFSLKTHLGNSVFRRSIFAETVFMPGHAVEVCTENKICFIIYSPFFDCISIVIFGLFRRGEFLT